MSKKILVADDDQGILDAICIMLEDAGYTVETTSNGGTLLKISEKKPDLILLDIWMSGMDGRDVCKALKSNPVTAQIPVILFSANKDTEKIAKEVGADDFILKPFEMDELLEKAEKWINGSV